MTEAVENLILEHLKGLRNELQTLRNESREQLAQIRSRLISLEERLTLVERGIANLHGVWASCMAGLTGSKPGSSASRSVWN